MDAMKEGKTADVIISMLKENTGAHFLDSGGAYGRNWERNQARDFESEPACRVDVFDWHEQDEDGPCADERSVDCMPPARVFRKVHTLLQNGYRHDFGAGWST